jgi:hypothetical protein
MPLAEQSPADYPAKWIAAAGEAVAVTVNGIHADTHGNIQLKYFVTKEEYREIKAESKLVPGARYIVTDKWRLPSIRDFSWMFANICAIRDALSKKTVDGVKQDGHGNTQLKQVVSSAEYNYLQRTGKLIPGARYIIYDRFRFPSVRDIGWMFTKICALLAADKALENKKVDKLTGETECDYIYAKRADGGQGYQELWTEPEPNSIPSRDDNGVLYAQPGTDDNAVVVKKQLNAETTARNTAIANAVQTTLKANPSSDTLPATTSSTFADLIQTIRDNLKWLFGKKADIASPVFTGTPKVPSKTGAAKNDGTLIATEAQLFWEAVERQTSISNAVAAHDESATAHNDLREAIAALPAIPQIPGDYKLVVEADGTASFKPI